jgi:iron complex outermembrane receptor protein
MYAKNRYADGGAIGAAVYFDPTKPVSANNDIYNKYFGGYTQWYTSATDEKGNNVYNDTAWPYQPEGNATTNPVALLKQKDDRATSKTFIGNIEADYKVHGFEDLHLHANGGMDISTGHQTTDISPYSKGNYYYGSHGWNKMNTYNLSLNMYAQYMKDFNKIHHIDAMAGYEWQHFHKTTNWYSYGRYQSTNADASLAGTIYNAPTTETRYKTENYLVSFFGRLNYSLYDRYLLTFTLRDDGSSRFSKDNRWGLFPSVALAWKVKEESFLKNVDAISDLKARVGYGVTGQQEGIGDYTYFASYTLNGNHAYYPIGVNSDGSTYRPDAYNADLTWEKTKTFNAGLDFGFLKDRIVFNVDYYYRKTTDLINTVFVSAGSNFKNKVTSNVGSLHNEGIEFASTVRPVQNKDWRWELTYNLTYNHNVIDKLVGGNGDNYYIETGGISAGTGGNIQAHAVGHAASSFYVYQQVYDKNGKPLQNTFVDRNGDGVINSSDKYFYKKPAADVLMGFGSKVMYKDWDFSFNLRASINNYVYNDTQAGSCNVGASAVYYGSQYLSNRPWRNVNIGMTSPQTEQYFSDYFVQNASFLKCDNITLGYSFERLFGAKISGRAYATVQNVFTITKYKGIDPEVSGGIDNNLYPRPFVSVLGLSLNF